MSIVAMRWRYRSWSFRARKKTLASGLGSSGGGLSCAVCAQRAGSRPARAPGPASLRGGGHRPPTIGARARVESVKPRGAWIPAVPIPDLLRELLARARAVRPRGAGGAGLAGRGLGVRRGAARTRSAPRSRACARGEGAPTLAVVGHIDEIGVRDHEHRGERAALVQHDRRVLARDAGRRSASRSPGARATCPA